MVSDSERTKILEMIEAGTISAEEGLTLLNALREAVSANETISEHPQIDPLEGIEELDYEPDDPYDKATPGYPSRTNVFNHRENDGFEDAAELIQPDVGVNHPPDAGDIKKWKRWWMIPLWIGAAITLIGGGLMYWAFSTNGFGFLFACAWFPLLMGVGILDLAWSSRTSPWLHVRVQQPPGEKPRKIAISFPIPVRLTAWGLRIFGHHIPHMENTNLDEVILALKDVATDGTPLSVDVSEGDDGERVQVFIG